MSKVFTCSAIISEVDFVQHIADGISRKDIADIYQVSVRTVESWAGKALLKYDAKNSAHLVAILFRNGLIT